MLSRESLPFSVLFENVSGGYDCRGLKPFEKPTTYAIGKYIDRYRQYNPDILGLVEVHSEDREGNSEMISEIAEALGIPNSPENVQNVVQSTSHLDPSKHLGTALLSKFRIIDSTMHCLPNPDLRFVHPNGDVFLSHNKHVQETILAVEKQQVRFQVFQGLPFHIFEKNLSDPEFIGYRGEVSSALSPIDTLPTIVAGDFNNKQLSLPDAFPGFIDEDNLQIAVSGGTIYDDTDQPDHILYTSKSLTVVEKSAFSELNRSDHKILVAQFVLK